jgi:putative ABC transport system permease protein
METLLQDLRYAARWLWRTPGFTAVALVTLALGIGANTAIFSLMYAVVLRPLPYPSAERIVTTNLSVPDYEDLRAASTSYEATAIWASNRYTLRSEAGDGQTEQVMGAVVGPGFFDILGRATVIGRVFTGAEDKEQLVVISHRYWQRRFGGSPQVLGRTLTLGGRVCTIVGVLPPEFEYPSSKFDLWSTFGVAMASTVGQAENRSLRIFKAVALLKPGVSVESARAEAATLSQRLQREHPDTNAGVTLRIVPLRERLLGSVQPALVVLLGTTAFVLLIACANVANLMLARATGRAREIAVRAALGASRARVARQLLVESLLLSLCGGLLGLGLARAVLLVLPRLNPEGLPRLGTVALNGPVLLFTLAVALVTGLAFGLLPAVQAGRSDLVASLKEGGRGGSGGRWARRVRQGLVVAEMAVSLILLVGSGLLVNSFTRLLHVDAGFVAEDLLTFNLELVTFEEPQQRAALVASVVDRLKEVPGVVAVGGGTGLPPLNAQRGTRFDVEGDAHPDPDGRSGYFLAVTPGYFDALGTRLLEGRAFEARDAKGAAPAVVVNARLARALFPQGGAVGHRLRLVNPEQTDEWRTIVGVVQDVRYSGLDDPTEFAVYTPFAQTPFLWSTLMVRIQGEPGPAMAAIRRAVPSVHPALLASGLQPMSQVVAESVAEPRFNMVLVSVFAALAVVLAAVGLYGVMAYLVTQLRRDIGVRMALGARGVDVLRLVLSQSLTLCAVGLGLGLLGAVFATRLLTALLFGVEPTDAPTFAAVSVLLLAVSLLASYVPARRAMRTDPIVALRYE